MLADTIVASRLIINNSAASKLPQCIHCVRFGRSDRSLLGGDAYDVTRSFLPEASALVQLGVEKEFSSAFKLRPSFWRSTSIEASGFFGSQGIPKTNDKSSSIFYRFLIKEPVARADSYPRLDGADSAYVWHKFAFCISWTTQCKIRVLCFGVPITFQQSITDSITRQIIHVDNSQGPLDLNNIIIEEVIALFDRSVWSWRDVVRDLEKNRPVKGDLPPDPDYTKMHEIARHIIHSSETISTAQKTLKAMFRCYDTIRATALLDTQSSEEVKAQLEQQASLLTCLRLRSEAIEARLRNEINLAFNLVAQYDARSAVQISANTATDSAAMKTISVLGLVFLPGTFICSIFSTTFFSFTPDATTSPEQRWVVSKMFWVYFAVAVPTTLITIACCATAGKRRRGGSLLYGKEA
ncbi:hypothetical protein MMC25_003202 [Agyrium rufum]|nr:hypothetical protein [Agyrium rufum]